MSLERVCYRCGAKEDHSNRMEVNARVAGGVALQPRIFCRNEDSCLARRFALPRTYSESHRTVLAFRKKTLER